MKITRRDESKDKVVVISANDGTAVIADVEDRDHERVIARSQHDSFSIPNGDLKSFTGENGRVYVYAASIENIEDSKRLAALEKSTVLKQITSYKDDAGDQTIDLMKILMLVAIVVLGIIAAVT